MFFISTPQITNEQQSTSMASQTTQAQQKYPRGACLECRKKHRCCSRELPCSRCKRLGIHCEYPAVPKKRGRPRKWPATGVQKSTTKSPTSFVPVVEYVTKLQENQNNLYYTRNFLPEVPEENPHNSKRLPSISELLQQSSAPSAQQHVRPCKQEEHKIEEHVSVANILLSFAANKRM